jgi:hypothetical protein
MESLDPLTPALIRFARSLAGDGGVLAIGIPGGPSLAGILAIDEDGARTLAEAARGEALDDPANVSRLTGVEADDLAQRTVLLLASRSHGWQLSDLLDLVPPLSSAVRRIVVVALPGGFTFTAERLGQLLEERGVPPLLTGLTPVSEYLAPAAPFAIVEREPERLPGRVAIALRCDDDLEAARFSLLALAGQPVSVILLDTGAGTTGAALAEMAGVASVLSVSEENAPAAAEQAAASLDATWIVDLVAGERLRSPWPDLPLDETLSRLGASGADHVIATMVATSAPLDGYQPGSSFWRFDASASSFDRVIARRLDASTTSDRSPYNIVVQRVDHSLAQDAPGVQTEPWALAVERGAHAIERLTGHGAYTLTWPAPVGLRWNAVETLMYWEGNLLKTAIGRIPFPDPLAPEPGAGLVRWDMPDGSAATLTLLRGDEAEVFAGRGPSGTITVDGLDPGVVAHMQLHQDEPVRKLVGEVRIWFDLEPEE